MAARSNTTNLHPKRKSSLRKSQRSKNLPRSQSRRKLSLKYRPLKSPLNLLPRNSKPTLKQLKRQLLRLPK